MSNFGKIRIYFLSVVFPIWRGKLNYSRGKLVYLYLWTTIDDENQNLCRYSAMIGSSIDKEAQKLRIKRISNNLC